jgi:hypothetical protein
MSEDNEPRLAVSPPPPRQISEETARQILAVTTKDLELKAQELELRREELKANATYAEAALSAQSKDRSEGRTHKRETANDKFKFVMKTTILLLLFAGFALYLNKEQVVLEALKIIGPFVAGAASGYYFGKRPLKQPDHPEG